MPFLFWALIGLIVFAALYWGCVMSSRPWRATPALVAALALAGGVPAQKGPSDPKPVEVPGSSVTVAILIGWIQVGDGRVPVYLVRRFWVGYVKSQSGEGLEIAG